MDTCVRCGAELGVGRFCLNCGHRIGEPAPVDVAPPPVQVAPKRPPAAEPPVVGTAVAEPAVVEPAADAPAEPTSLPVQAADPTPVPPATPVAPAAPIAPPRSESDWDPRDELLPYEVVDDPGSDDPLKGRAWIAWVLGAVLLVGLVLVLLEAFDTDADDGTATDPGSSASSAGGGGGAEETGTSEESAGVGKRRQLARAASVAVPDTAPPTTDLDGNLVAYEASQMHDGNPTTTWRMAGDASGQTITVTLAEPGVVERVGLVNGYTKQVAGVSWYPNNRRILAVTWTFDDGTTVDQALTERPGMQVIEVPPVETGTVELTIGSVTAPGSGNLGRDYTAISEVTIIGRRAG
ncbi:MAG TPA: hypothetical protein VLK03_03815 [Nocardioides sp.]|nr:hypothetical protein [Nocardioides sp.]